MQLGEFKVTGLEYLEDSPGPIDGQAIVLQPEPEPLPNANTIEGVIQGYGLMASNARRHGGWPKVVMTMILLGFILPTIGALVTYIVMMF